MKTVKDKIRQRPTKGIIKICGLEFSMVAGFWAGQFCENLVIRVDYSGQTKECILFDDRDDSRFGFETVSACKSFAKRRRHGRTLEEHYRAESLLTEKEKHGWSIKETAEKCGVSPRTIEAWFSGCRVVPVDLEF